jgi:hypothetical protein
MKLDMIQIMCRLCMAQHFVLNWNKNDWRFFAKHSFEQSTVDGVRGIMCDGDESSPISHTRQPTVLHTTQRASYTKTIALERMHGQASDQII